MVGIEEEQACRMYAADSSLGGRRRALKYDVVVVDVVVVE
jgi:hypothetical protein